MNAGEAPQAVARPLAENQFLLSHGDTCTSRIGAGREYALK
jgi:hypothetical protein